MFFLSGEGNQRSLCGIEVIFPLSKRNISTFFSLIDIHPDSQYLKEFDQLESGRFGFNHVIDIASCHSEIRVGELFLVFSPAQQPPFQDQKLSRFPCEELFQQHPSLP
jgi:hypothetical protein